MKKEKRKEFRIEIACTVAGCETSTLLFTESDYFSIYRPKQSFRTAHTLNSQRNFELHTPTHTTIMVIADIPYVNILTSYIAN